jgi:hypothetical protein
MTARKNTATAPATQYAVVNSVSGSNYTAFQIKVWDAVAKKSVLYAEGFDTRIAAKRAVDADDKLTRVDNFRVAREHAEGIVIPAKKGHSRSVKDDTFNGALAASLEQYTAA